MTAALALRRSACLKAHLGFLGSRTTSTEAPLLRGNQSSGAPRRRICTHSSARSQRRRDARERLEGRGVLVAVARRQREGDDVDARRRLRDELFFLEQLHDHGVAEAEADGGQGVPPERLEEPVVPPAPRDGPQRPLPVEGLEHDARVVREPSDDRRVDHDPVPEAARLGQVDERPQVRQGGPVADQRLEGRERAAGVGRVPEHGGQRVDVGRRHAERAEVAVQRLGRHLLQLVDQHAARREARRVRRGVDAARPRQQLRQHGARVDLDAHVVRGQADALHERDHGRQGLRLRRGAVDAPDVHVPPATASRSFASVPPPRPPSSGRRAAGAPRRMMSTRRSTGSAPAAVPSWSARSASTAGSRTT